MEGKGVGEIIDRNNQILAQKINAISVEFSLAKP